MIDHRRLGRELGLFDSDPLIGAGLPYWLPAGAAVRHALEEYVRGVEQRGGYQHVHSPVLGKRELYELSGHWAHYREDMFPPMDIGGEQVVLRPSLCPHHALIFRSRGRGYRELPLRIAELGGQYRAELSGVLGGLSRTRAMQLNDAHIFCAADDVGAEVAGALGMIVSAYRAMGIRPARYRLSLPGAGDKYLPGAQMWARAGAALVEALDSAGIGYERGDGEAAFYGPKIDVQVADAAGRESTLSTVQVDFFQPERFGLRYAAAGGGHERPVLVHRSIVGSLERAVACLIEAHGGAFPPWLAPVQVLVLPVTGAQAAAAAAFADRCLDAGLRVEVAAEGSLGGRVRAALLVPYLAVIGPAEAGAGEVALRLRDGRRLDPLPAAEAAARLDAAVRARSVALWP
jgi:threonyl-tRNA synthetase